MARKSALYFRDSLGETRALAVILSGGMAHKPVHDGAAPPLRIPVKLNTDSGEH